MIEDRLPESVASAAGLSDGDRATVRELVDVWRRKRHRNVVRSAYYDMHRAARDLGIAVPPSLRELEQVCGWPAKAVDSLAVRSQFDGFVCSDQAAQDRLSRLVARDRLKRVYRMACRSELKHSCSFLAVTAADDGSALVSAYPATGASALWDDRAKRVRAGLVVVERDRRRGSEPTLVNVFTDDAVIRISRRAGERWRAEYLEHSMGRPLMEPLAYSAELERPFGKSRISRAVMNITDDAMRASKRSEVSAEFFTSPQKYLLGVGEDAFEDKTKWEAYIGTIFAIGKDEDGNTPSFGQLAQGSMQPHIDYMRSLAARFSGETNVPVSSLGVVSDNPSSAEAIYAAKEDMVVDAQELNSDNGDALRNVALMALAVEEGTTFAEQEARGLDVQAKFRNPAMPSIVSQADAMTKMISAIPWLADTDVALEEFGFSDDQIQRLKSDRAKARVSDAFASILSGAADGKDTQGAAGRADEGD